MNEYLPLQCLDYIIVVVLLPVFVARVVHWSFDRNLFRDKRADQLVDSFEKRFRDDIRRIEVRPGRFISLLHRRIDSRESSKGLIIFVHGSCARMQQLEHLIEFFSNAGYETISYDALGCGLSAKPVGESLYVTSEMYQDFLNVVRKYTADRGIKAVCVIGHSFAGAMVTKFAASAESSRLTMSAVSICQPAGLSNHTKTMSIFRLPISILWLIRPLLGIRARELLFGPKASDDLRRQEKEASARNPVHMFRSFYNGYDRSFFSPDEMGNTLHIPVLYIAGEYDKICPPDQVKMVAERFQSTVAKYVVASACGHQCMQEDPNQIIKIIQAHIEQ
jgi:pimeloyl-ACP methyl ester carboxylesterase